MRAPAAGRALLAWLVAAPVLISAGAGETPGPEATGGTCPVSATNCFACARNGTPGCEDPDCCAVVCAEDPGCCTDEWDCNCRVAAWITCGGCGDPGAGDCFDGLNLTPGCDDLTCCGTVCELDAWCCTVQWDNVCASLAGSFCGQPCPWDCDANSDGNANVLDLLAMIGQYDVDAPFVCDGGPCDFDGNGCVDVQDLLKLLGHYTTDPTGFGCP